MARSSKPSAVDVAGVTGGYDAQFDPPIDTKYVCPVCLAALRGPLQTKCGHRFCKTCLRRIIGSRPHTKCPVDKTWLDVKSDIFEDVAVEREILSMTVLCSNLSNGCSWRGDLRHFKSHCDTCPCTKLVCPNGCEEQYLRGESEEHLRDCPLRVLECSHCGETIVKKDEVRHQTLVCPRYPIQCAECRSDGIIREEMEKHRDVTGGNCPSTVIPCTFQELGCSAQMKRSDLTTHNQDAMANHMQLLLEQLTTQKTLLSKQHASLEETSDVNRRLMSEVDEMKRNLSEKDQLLNQQVERISHLENTSYDGRLHWKINLNSFDQSNTTSSTRILSPAFYTGRPGYKLRACLEIDGHATRNSTYTSLFIMLQEGTYDERLHFPFSTECHVKLFDQCEDAQGHTDFVTTITCCNMPRARSGNMREQFRGRLRFMQTEALTKGHFVSSGVLFMQINVGLSSLKM